MRPLICPQCGGQITEYAAGATFVTCAYCSTKFLIEDNKQPVDDDPVPVYTEIADPSSMSTNVVVGIVVVTIILVGFGILLSVVAKKNSTSSGYSLAPMFQAKSPTPLPTPTPDAAILLFGGKGTENGEFDGARTIAVDALGRIYVGDEKLRVQEFDANGQFVKLLKVPANGSVYNRAHYVEEVQVGGDGRLFVGVGGVILVYPDNWAAKPRTIHVAPDYITSFDLKADGSMLAVSYSDDDESLLFVGKTGGVSRRIEGFHTDALNAAISPLGTAGESVRIAVDQKGGFFSIYALAALGNYSLSYNNEDLAIAKFTAAGKFVKSFAPTPDVHGMFVDGQNRLNVWNGDTVFLYDADGNYLSSFTPGRKMDALTVDENGFLYVVSDDVVAKYLPIP